MEDKIIALLQDEIEKKQLESALLQVAKNGEVIVQEAIGTPVDSVFDAGSLVEIVAILPAVLKLVERRKKKIALNHPVSHYISGFSQEGKENVQIMNLLTHTSGLPDDKNIGLDDISKAPLEFKPGSKVAYSSLNFQLLPQIYEAASGYAFQQFLEDFIFNPLLMTNSRVEQKKNGRFTLFSTLSDLAHFTSMMEQNGTYDYLKIINKRAVLFSKQNFTSFLNENRGLGWELQTDTPASGSAFSEESYGFMGPDGMSMWFDPKKKLSILLKLDQVQDKKELHRMRVNVHQLVRGTF